MWKKVILDTEEFKKIEGINWSDENVKAFRSKWKKRRGLFWCNWNSSYTLEVAPKIWEESWQELERNLIKTIEEQKEQKDKEFTDKVVELLDRVTFWIANYSKEFYRSEWEVIQKNEKIKAKIKKHFDSKTSKAVERKIMLVNQSLNNWELETKPPLDLNSEQIKDALQRIKFKGVSMDTKMMKKNLELKSDLEQNNYYFKKMDH